MGGIERPDVGVYQTFWTYKISMGWTVKEIMRTEEGDLPDMVRSSLAKGWHQGVYRAKLGNYTLLVCCIRIE